MVSNIMISIKNRPSSEHNYTFHEAGPQRKNYSGSARSNAICSVFGCSNRANPAQKISLYKFPSNANKTLRKAWTAKLRLGKVPKTAYACSRHFTAKDFISPKKGKGKFLRLRKHAVPSQNIPKRSLEFSRTLGKKQKEAERLERLTNRKLLFESLQTKS